MDLGYAHTKIDKQLVKEERIKKKPADISFEVFNINSTKNREVTRFALLKVKINRYKEYIDMIVMDLNGTDMFLEHNWLVKHNPEVNWDKGTVRFTRYPKIYRTIH